MFRQVILDLVGFATINHRRIASCNITLVLKGEMEVCKKCVKNNPSRPSNLCGEQV
jgi:hypothetical protein